MNNTNQVLVTVRPVGDWIKTTEKAVASGASVCLQAFGFEEHIEELWNQCLAKFRTGIFAVSCKDFKTAKALQAIAELNGSALTRSLRVIIPWHRVSREQIVELNGLNPIPRLGSIQDVEQYAKSPWDQQNDPCVIIEGYESGGLCGRDSQYILFQKALSCLNDCRMIVAGPIGLLSFSALNSQGIHSILLDEQTLLLHDSYLPLRTKQLLNRVNGRQSIVLRSALDINEEVRCVSLPGKGAPGYLFGSSIDASELNEIARWNSEWIFPVGEGIDLAKEFCVKYRTLGRVISAYRSLRVSRGLATRQPNTIADQFGVKYPIIQGPMSRVSDNAEFAASVARGGALPTIAAAMLSAEALEKVLVKTAELVPDLPWGVGLLGFIDSAHLQSQISVLKHSSASFCILAGGTPAQAKEIASKNLRVFIHAPTPELLELFIKEGWRDFILEGRECGGHIGPLSSLNLWERSIKVVLEQSPAVGREVCLVLAGGIHDQTSAAFAAYMVDDLAKVGATCGLLVGSAYLATREIVQDKAITPTYQEVTIECTNTVFLETSPGHQSRCADTAFSREFNAKRDELVRSQVPVREISNQLDRLILGRLRLASKGLQRGESGLLQVTEEDQLELGMYMLGEAVCLINNQTTIHQLHESIKAGLETPSKAAEFEITERASIREANENYRGSLDIAIIGMSCKLPGANNPEQFWDLVVRAKGQIKEIPGERWSIGDFYSADAKEPNKIHSKWGGFLDAVQFDPIEFGIPPQSLSSIDPAQLLALVCVKDALHNAGYFEDSTYDRESTCVILGYSGGLGELGQGYVMQAELAPLLNSQPQVEQLLPKWTSDSFAGILPNVSAGRVANRFNFGGTNCTVDAACASSLAALDVAVSKLRQGEVNMAVVGAIDTLQSPFAYFCFSETQALSPTGEAKSFTNEADGIVLGEGAGILVLKRLEDAEAAGDSIHAVIKGIGSSSDGRGRTMTAPSHQGQVQAFARAYEDAGVNPAMLGYYEAHGTGTPVGDRSEIRALTTFLEAQGSQSSHCAVGSVKTLIGHTKSTAGLAGLLKATLALKYKSIPMHSRVEEHIDEVVSSEAVYLPTGNLPWLKNESCKLRTAGVSAFGFGGTNFHVVLQEYVPEPVVDAEEVIEQPKIACGCRILYFTADGGSLVQSIHSALTHSRLIEEECALNGYATSVNQLIADTIQSQDISTHLHSIAKDYAIILVDLSESDIADKLDIVHDLLQGKKDYSDLMRQWLVCQSVSAGLQIKSKNADEIALLFPGQGSDYPGMGTTCMGAMPLRSHELLMQLIPDYLSRADVLDHYIFCKQEKGKAPAAELKQSLLAITEVAYLEILNHLEIPWSLGLGHSLGDFVSLHATGWMTDRQLVELLRSRGQAISNFKKDGYGMLVLFCSADQGNELLSSVAPHSITLANINSPTQIVLSGPRSDLEIIEATCLRGGVSTQWMQANQPFHSVLMQECNAIFSDCLGALEFKADLPHSRQSILSTSPRSGPVTKENIRDLIRSHMTSGVDFIESVKQAEALGCSFFIEVGPKKVLSKLVRSSINSLDSNVVSLDGPLGTEDFLRSIMQIASHGVPLNWTRLSAMLQPAESLYLNHSSVGVSNAVSKRPGYFYYVNGAHSWKSRHKLESSSQHSVHHALSEITRPSAEQIPAQDMADSLLLPSVQSHSSNHQVVPMNQPIQPTQSSQLSSLRLEAFRTYHETLRMMIDSQTQVFSAFLGGSPQHSASLDSPDFIYTQQPFSGPTFSSDAISYSTPEAIHFTTPVTPANSQQQPVQSSASSSQSNGNGGVIHNPTPSPTPAPTPINPVPGPQHSQAVEVQVPSPSNGHGSVAAESRKILNLDAGSILSQLTSLLSEKSGYPIELLDPDQDLESDLGIDSIKRIEVMGGLMSTLSDVSPEAIQSIQTGTRDLRTLREVSEHIAAILNGAADHEVAAEVSQPGK
jgi:acyl transferase domain-containing protein/NAD(P)H-dependent flavin oxidoreductase YrpB (nitropropane dioxygenase family)/acyl carrier protein